MQDSNDLVFAILGFALLLAFLVPAVFFLLTQQNTLKLIQPINRTINPGQVWLQLIPVFNLYYQFVVVTGISNSLQREFNSYFNDSDSILPDERVTGATGGKRPLYSSGMTYCWLFLISTGGRWLPSFFSLLSGLVSFAAIVFWIVYWVQLVEYKKKLQGLRPA